MAGSYIQTCALLSAPVAKLSDPWIAGLRRPHNGAGRGTAVVTGQFRRRVRTIGRMASMWLEAFTVLEMELILSALLVRTSYGKPSALASHRIDAPSCFFFAASANRTLAEAISMQLGVPLGLCDITLP